MAAAASRRLYVDVTTTFEERGRHAHGTTRVERGLVGALATMEHSGITFCRYSRTTGLFSTAEPAAVLATATAATRSEERQTLVRGSRPPVLRLGRRIEATMRSRIRNPLRRGLAQITRRIAPPADLFVPGSTLLIAGELQRHDFALLTAMKRKLRLKLVFLFYDLHNVLPPDDPRLADPAAADLPGTDFMVREGDLLLAISEFSAGVLAGHLATRGLAGPPVRVIRLAGSFSPDVPMAPQPDLKPGGFAMMVGDICQRKNQALLVSTWRRLAAQRTMPPLVLVGRVDPECAAMVQEIDADPQLRTLIKVLPNASDAALAWLYANCRFTLFPSINEGFGLPVAESMSFGKVCLASSVTAVPEAGQGVAVSLDPRDEAAWCAAVERLVGDAAELKRLEAEIAARFRPVTWLETAAEVLAAIEA